MNLLISFLPIFLFISLYVGSGLYFLSIGTQNAFYQISPLVAILPAIALGWLLHKGKTSERMEAFLEGTRHKDIITMCIIFLLAGAFTAVTKDIGSVEATVNLALNIIPPKFLLVGLFITSAFISTAIGTSMGTIATIAPIASGLVDQGALPAGLALATVVGGAMFGDNLSLISDTTIASVMSQEADFRAKLKINAIVAIIASSITILILLNVHNIQAEIQPSEYSVSLILPYIFLILLVLIGTNVFVSLGSSLIFAFIIGYWHHSYNLLLLNKSIVTGFADMYEIMLLSLMVGGLSGLINNSSKNLGEYLAKLILKEESKIKAQLLIAKIVSIFDILFANNTIAIIFTGKIAREIGEKYNIPPHKTAAWLDIFSCVFQGIIPYGAQILLASKIAGLSPLDITLKVYYCYILGVVSILYIIFKRQ